MSESIIALETAEIRASADLYAAAPARVAATAGVSIRHLGDIAVTAVTTIDVLALNRVMGLGLRSAPSDTTLDELIATFDRIGSPRFFVPVAPVEGHELLAARLERRGMRHYNNWMRLRRDLVDLPPSEPSSFVVRRIGEDEADRFSALVATAFGYPPAIAPLSGAVVGRPAWQHYMAYDDETPIGAAALYIASEAAWFGFAATDVRQRRRGVQRALVTARLHAAKAEGCRWVSVETAEDTVTRDAPSFRNLRRLGFDVAYRRPNYLWTRVVPQRS